MPRPHFVRPRNDVLNNAPKPNVGVPSALRNDGLCHPELDSGSHSREKYAIAGQARNDEKYYAEFILAFQITSLRGAKRRGNPLKIAPSLTLPHGEGTMLYPLAPCGRADLRTDGVKRVRIASRLSEVHVCAISETL